MEKPKMIVFDYGYTLIYEQDFDGIRGTEAVLKYATKNANNLSASEISDLSGKLFEDIGIRARDNGIEVHNHMFQKLLYEYLEIDFSLSEDELELLFWDNAAPGIPMPNVERLIDYINSQGIRSGVISNISFSGDAVTERINRLLPNMVSK